MAGKTPAKPAGVAGNGIKKTPISAPKQKSLYSFFGKKPGTATPKAQFDDTPTPSSDPVLPSSPIRRMDVDTPSGGVKS